ncbi:methylated-DNA-[protein]-cysteine S-methyltransferase [Actinomyces ruminicola]|uniref:methylated-DNA--[protein]-cysteine S-methyltransferase n=1 Tax=Actinomyces ruminicola TaxID=332524 RepID=A0A1G9ZXV9_9ACTO|nr:methylated-DNA--[protein]-cysteine S-methyltransferase [Actinomyces ruminicola]SDN25934.1 methylated-DNA-[protein]-cysteine S-methyltransferase [Actinomyces ruminicola]
MTPAAQYAEAYLQAYTSPLGPMTLAAATGEGLPEGGAVVGAWFDGQKHDRAGLADGALTVAAGDPAEPAVLAATRTWLERYFAGADPGPMPALASTGTAFQQDVWARLRTIPRGRTTTYGRIAADLAAETGRPTSARAVGSAVGRNPISVLVPCHRVLGANGALTGYAGGPERKAALLRLEGVTVA